ncbi:MAG: glucose-6-phosphate dehydrogenase [Limnohabitans sp.]|nr:glucose-6-phosphate dehydrogenase [Limnohabitans sp.]
MAQDIQHPSTAPGDPAPSCTMVIFGAGGDLTKRLLMPALYNLARTGLLPAQFALVGVDRLEMTDQQFQSHVEQAIRAFAADKHYAQALEEGNLSRLIKSMVYMSLDFSAEKSYMELKNHLTQLKVSHKVNDNVMFYLAVGARFFGGIVDQLGSACLVQETPQYWRRVVVEKPFGHDLASAQALNDQLRMCLSESQIYRMDHFLGKETVQNIMLMRFANGIFEPLWNRDHIDHVQITVAETVGVESRAAFYETTGALRDMVPNHVFQLLALTAMEPPASFDADAVRNEKTKVLHSVHAVEPLIDTVRAQYSPGELDEKKHAGYRQENRVAAKSQTETYVAMKLGVDNWRWAGVPFYLRTGKAMAQRKSEIVIQFKRPPLSFFKNTATDSLKPNTLILKLQPDEGATLSFGAKIPGPKIDIGQVKMDFHYKDYFQNAPSTGYETLIYDCMIGDATLFQRSDSVMAGWKIVEPLQKAWSQDLAPLAFYEAGSEGPNEADQLLHVSGRSWNRIGEH